jgi:hypothetical protein
MEIRNNWNRFGAVSRTNGGKKDGIVRRWPGRSGRFWSDAVERLQMDRSMRITDYLKGDGTPHLGN